MSIEAVGARDVRARYSRYLGRDNVKPSHVLCDCYESCPLFLCPACNAWQPFCHGCSDNMPEICDTCWCRYTAAGQVFGEVLS